MVDGPTHFRVGALTASATMFAAERTSSQKGIRQLNAGDPECQPVCTEPPSVPDTVQGSGPKCSTAAIEEGGSRHGK
jgi:hypothetical protein